MFSAIFRCAQCDNDVELRGTRHELSGTYQCSDCQCLLIRVVPSTPSLIKPTDYTNQLYHQSIRTLRRLLIVHASFYIAACGGATKNICATNLLAGE